MHRRHATSLLLISVANTAAMLACGPTLAACAADCAKRFLLEQAAKSAHDVGTVPTTPQSSQPDSHEPRTVLASFDCPKNVKPAGGDSVEVLPCVAVASPTPPMLRSSRWVGFLATTSAARHTHDLTGYWALAPPAISPLCVA